MISFEGIVVRPRKKKEEKSHRTTTWLISCLEHLHQIDAAAVGTDDAENDDADDDGITADEVAASAARSTDGVGREKRN